MRECFVVVGEREVRYLYGFEDIETCFLACRMKQITSSTYPCLSPRSSAGIV